MNSRSLFAIALVVAISLVAADLAPSDATGFSEDNSERDTQFQLQNNQVQIQSEARAGDIRDKFNLEFKGDSDYVELKMDREARANSTTNRFRFRVRFFGIREYVETDGTPGFSSMSEACGTPFLISGNSNGFQFSNLPTTYFYDATNNRNVTIRNFKGQTQNGLFQVIVHLSGGGNGERNGKFRLNGRDVPPTAIKFDVVIDPQGAGYNWKCGNNTNSRLALIVKTKSAARMAPGTSDALKFGGDTATPLGFFTWSPTVTVAGSTTPANVLFGNFVQQANTDSDADNDLGSGEVAYRAVYSFDVARPSKLTWDPELGYMAGPGAPPNSGASVTASLLLLALLALLQVLFL